MSGLHLAMADRIIIQEEEGVRGAPGGHRETGMVICGWCVATFAILHLPLVAAAKVKFTLISATQ